MMPGVSGPEKLGPVDALFTATSAVCVTGLVVVDTGTAFTVPGQIIILCLIQLGGLGMMTFSLFIIILIGKRSSLRDELAVRGTFSHLHGQSVKELVRSILLITFSVELIGAVLLFFIWAGDYPTAKAAYLAIFHSVSAFCNAGFSLFPDSLIGYKTNAAVNIVMIFLIVIGGIGFIVIKDLQALAFRKPHRLTLHSKLVIWTTLVLGAGGAIVFLFMEWDNVLAGLPLADKFIISFFQAITPRTAGFNSIDYNHLTNTTLLMTIFFMFIGGSPGSTAGGVKTINLTILLGLAVNRFRGFSRVNMFKRSVPDENVARSLTIILAAISVVTICLVCLLSTETAHLDHTTTRDMFLKLFFETVSAFGTVGLSMGMTGDLTAWGKVIIILTMFLGRVGPLTLALALTNRSRPGRTYHYGSEEVMVG